MISCCSCTSGTVVKGSGCGEWLTHCIIYYYCCYFYFILFYYYYYCYFNLSNYFWYYLLLLFCLHDVCMLGAIVTCHVSLGDTRVYPPPPPDGPFPWFSIGVVIYLLDLLHLLHLLHRACR